MAETAASAEKRPRRRTAARPPPVESKPIVGGRLWIAIGMLVALGVIANPNFNSFVIQQWGPTLEARTGGNWAVGQKATINVTLITADYLRLSCGHNDEFKGTHCEFNEAGRPWPRDDGAPLDDNKTSVIQPYRTTTDNKLILIAGLWATTDLAMRLHNEPPQGVPEKRLIRFDAMCEVEFIGQMDSVKLRWDVGSNWQTERNALVARPISCELTTE